MAAMLQVSHSASNATHRSTCGDGRYATPAAFLKDFSSSLSTTTAHKVWHKVTAAGASFLLPQAPFSVRTFWFCCVLWKKESSISVSVGSLLLIPEERKNSQEAVRRAKTEIRFYFICFSFLKCPVAASFLVILRQNARWKPCAVRVWARFLREAPDEWINYRWPAAKVGAAPRQVVRGVKPWQTQFTLLCFVTLQLSGGVSERLASKRRRKKKDDGRTRKKNKVQSERRFKAVKKNRKKKNPVSCSPAFAFIR